MAYQIPPTWDHGEFPTAAELTKYKDALDAIYALTGGARIHYPVARRMSGLEAYWMINKYRWLIYRGNGVIIDPDNTDTNRTTLSGDGSAWLTFDLAQLDWLIQGKLYVVEDVMGAFEDYEAL